MRYQITFFVTLILSWFTFSSTIKASTCTSYLTYESEVQTQKILNQIESIRNQEDQLGVIDDFKTRAYLKTSTNGKIQKTRISAVIFHGLLNEPTFKRAMAEYIFSLLGFNVINVRLAKHAEGNRSNLDQVSYAEWIQQVKVIGALAKDLGEKVVFIGHSTGGLMAIEGLLTNPKTTAGIVTLSPALQVRKRVQIKSLGFSALGVSGNLIDFINKLLGKPLGRYMSTYAGVQVPLLAKYINQKLENLRSKNSGLDVFNNIPALGLDTAIDKVINPENNKKFYRGLNNKNHIMLPDSFNVAHNDIGISYNEGNPAGGLVFAEIIEFLSKL